MAKASPFDPELVRELASLIAETDLTEIEVAKGDLRIRVARTLCDLEARDVVAAGDIHEAAGFRALDTDPLIDPRRYFGAPRDDDGRHA